MQNQPYTDLMYLRHFYNHVFHATSGPRHSSAKSSPDIDSSPSPPFTLNCIVSSTTKCTATWSRMSRRGNKQCIACWSQDRGLGGNC